MERRSAIGDVAAIEMVRCETPEAAYDRLLSLYQDGELKLDELVTRRYRLDQINDAIRDMRDGRNIRGVIEFEP